MIAPNRYLHTVRSAFPRDRGASCRFDDSSACPLPSVDPPGRCVWADNSTLPGELHQQHPNPPHGPSCYTVSECSGTFRALAVLHVMCRCRTTKSHPLSPLSRESRTSAGSPRLRYPSHKRRPAFAAQHRMSQCTSLHLSSSRVCATRKVEASRRVQKK